MKRLDRNKLRINFLKMIKIFKEKCLLMNYKEL